MEDEIVYDPTYGFFVKCNGKWRADRLEFESSLRRILQEETSLYESNIVGGGVLTHQEVLILIDNKDS